MSTRVSDNSIYNQSLQSMGDSRAKMVKTHEQSVSLKRLNRPSDDPAGIIRTINLKADKDRANKVEENLELAKGIVNMTDTALGDLTEVINRAKELAIQLSSTSNQQPESLASVAREVEQLYLQGVQIANSRVGDKYIFGGMQTDKPPFDERGNYYGDAQTFSLEFSGGQKLPINSTGAQVFFGITEIPQKEPLVDEEGNPVPNPPVISNDFGTLSLRAPASEEAKLADDSAFKEVGKPVHETPSNNSINVLGTLKTFSDSLKNEEVGGIQESLDNLDRAFQQIVTMRTSVGAQQKMLDLGVQNQIDTAISTGDLISKVEDADAIQTFSEMARNENLLKVSMETNKKLLTPSLMEFLK